MKVSAICFQPIQNSSTLLNIIFYPIYLELRLRKLRIILDTLKSDQIVESSVRLVELKLSSNFALPLETQKTLSENDPISYLTGNMTNLKKDELISFQIVVSPVMNVFHQRVMAGVKELRTRIYQGLPLTESVQKNVFQKFVSLPIISILWWVIKGIGKIVHLLFLFIISIIPAIVDTSGKSVPLFQTSSKSPKEILNPYEQELAKIIKDKIDRSLFEISIKLLVVTRREEDNKTRVNGLIAIIWTIK